MGTQPYQDDELEAARIRFGRLVKAWMHSGGWSTKTAMEWAKAAGLPQLSNNTVSFIWGGTQPKTSPRFFTTIGYLNQRLADQDYGPITSRALRDRVANLTPIRHPNGTPWGAVDFFACYIGQLEPPPEYNTGPPEKLQLLSVDVAERISSQKRELFEQHATTCELSKAEAWNALKRHCSAFSEQQLDALQQVLAGWRSWTPMELQELTNADGHDLVLMALQDWLGQPVISPLPPEADPPPPPLDASGYVHVA